jgi:hypothetical protein
MVAFKINGPAGPAGLGGTGRSRSPRRRVLLTGTFHSLTSSWPAAVRNISCTGAAIECDGALKIGAEGVLEAERLDTLCRVVWQKGRVFGLAFDEPLPNCLVLDLHRITEADVQQANAAAAREWFEASAR